MTDKIRIAIVDDHKLMRDALKALIAGREDMEVVGEAGDGQSALRMAVNVVPDVLLLDLSMPKLGGLSVLSDLKREVPNIKILVTTIHESEKYIVEVFEAGADGYFVKTGRWEELLVAIEQVVGGKTYISPSIADNVLQGYIQGRKVSETAPNPKMLTPREREVLKLLASGHKPKEIAALLSISDKTVEKHLSNIMKKLDLHNAPALVTYAFRNNLG